MVRPIYNSRGIVVDFDIDAPEGSFGSCVETCVLCGCEYNAALYDNHAGTCKGCWSELRGAMRSRLLAAVGSFTPQELKLLDNWGNLEDMFFDVVDTCIKGKPKRKK